MCSYHYSITPRSLLHHAFLYIFIMFSSLLNWLRYASLQHYCNYCTTSELTLAVPILMQSEARRRENVIIQRYLMEIKWY